MPRAAICSMNDTGRRILLGRVLGAFGIRGEAKLESWTEPRAAIFRYQPWIVRDPQGRERELSGVRGRESGKFLIATWPDVTDRDVVEAMRGTEIYVPRSALPPPSRASTTGSTSRACASSPSTASRWARSRTCSPPAPTTCWWRATTSANA